MRTQTHEHVCYNATSKKLETKILSFDDCQEFIGGYIENYQIGENLFIYIHETGAMGKRHLPVLLSYKNLYGLEIKKIFYGNIIFLRYDQDSNRIGTKKKHLKDIELREPTFLEMSKAG